MEKDQTDKRGKYLSTKKVRPVLRKQIPKSKLKKTGVRKHVQAISDHIDREMEWLHQIIELNELGRAFSRGKSGSASPIVVAGDLEQDVFSLYDLNPKELPEWNKLSDLMKARIGFLMCIEFGGYAFTANVAPELEERWLKNNRDPRKQALKLIRKRLANERLNDMPFCFALEAKNKWGNSSTHIHLHGYFLADNPTQATKMKTVFEKALYRKLKVMKGRNAPVKIELAYAHPDPTKGPIWYAHYMAKNTRVPGPKIPDPSIYLSTSLTQSVKDYWSIIRDQ